MSHTLISVNGVGDLSVFVLRDYWIDRTRCNAVGSDFQSIDGLCLDWAARKGSGMFVPTVWTLERDGIATVRNWFIIAAFHTLLVTTSVCLSGMTPGADGAGGKVFFA